MSGGVSELAWDCAQFGIRVGTLDLDRPGSEEALETQAAGYDLVYAHSRRESALPEDVLARLNGVLADRRVSFRRAVSKPAGSATALAGEIRSIGADDREANRLIELAPRAAEYSRFRSDPTFPGAWTEALYRAWMQNSLTRERADEVLAYLEAGRALGFYTVRTCDGVARLELFAVDPSARRRGIGSALLEAGLGWARERRIEQASVTTQRANPACALYRAFGYTEFEREAIYHLWPNGAPADP